MSEKKCQQLELVPGKTGKEKYKECGLPAVCKGTKYLEIYFCKHHAPFAMIAGCEIKPIKEVRGES